MKKAVFLFSVAVISTKVWGTQNVFVTPPVNPQSNVNREVIQSTQISYTTRPVENSVTETQITNDLNDRAHARRLNNHILTGINEGSSSIRSRSYTTQNRVPTLGRRNDQNFMRHRMWNRPYTPQNAIIPLSVPRNCYVSRGNNIIRLFTRRTYVSFYDTVYIETSEFQSTPQQAVTYPYNIPYASGRWPHSQLQPPFDASRDLANQDDDDLQGGWLDSLYNSMMQPDLPNSSTSTSQPDDSTNEMGPSNDDSDEYDNIPLSQTRSLRKKKTNAKNTPYFPKKKD